MGKLLFCKKCGQKLDIDWEKMEMEYFDRGFGLLKKGLCKECLQKEILKRIEKE